MSAHPTIDPILRPRFVIFRMIGTVCALLCLLAAPASAQIFAFAPDELQVAASDPYQEQIQLLEDVSGAFSDRLERTQSLIDYRIRRLSERRANAEVSLDELRDAELGLAVGDVRRHQLLLAIERTRDAIGMVSEMQRAFDSRIVFLSEATSRTRHLAVELRLALEMSTEANSLMASEQFRRLGQRVQFLVEHRVHLLTSRDALELQTQQLYEEVEHLRESVLEQDQERVSRLDNISQARGGAYDDACAVIEVGRALCDEIYTESLEQLRDALRVRQVRSLVTLGLFALPPQAGATSGTISLVLHTHLLADLRPILLRNGMQPSLQSASIRVDLAVQRGQRVLSPRTVSPMELIEGFEDSSALVLSSALSELVRERLEGVHIQLEVVGVELPALNTLHAMWEQLLAEAAAHEEGGVFNREASAFSEELLVPLIEHTKKLLADYETIPGRIAQAFRLLPGDRELGLPDWLLLIFVGLVAFYARRPLYRLLRRYEPKFPSELVLASVLKHVVRYLPLLAVAVVMLLRRTVPGDARPVGWVLAVTPTVHVLLSAVVRGYLPIDAPKLISVHLAKRLRLFFQLVLGAAVILQMFAVALPFLQYPESTQRPVQTAVFMTLVIGFSSVLLLGRLGKNHTSSGAGKSGYLTVVLARLYPLVVVGPVAIVIAEAMGYRNLALFVFWRGLILLMVLVALPWIHSQMHRKTRWLLGYPGGGGPLGFTKTRAETGYRMVAPLVSAMVILITVGLVATTWGYHGGVLAAILSILTFTFVPIGDGGISLISLMFCSAVITAVFVVAQWTRTVLSERIYPIYALTPGIRASFDTLAKYLFFLLGGLGVLQVLELGLGFMAVFAGVLSIGIGFGSQTLLANFIAGLILQVTRPVEVGHIIEVGGVLGRVEEITSYATVVRTYDDLAVIVPNAALVANSVVNWTSGNPRVRVGVSIGVAYGSDVEKVTALLIEVANREEKVIGFPSPTCRFRDHRDSALEFTLYCWIGNPRDAPLVKSKLRYGIESALKAANITIPFPQQDLHIRSADTQLQTLQIVADRGWDVKKIPRDTESGDDAESDAENGDLTGAIEDQ